MSEKITKTKKVVAKKDAEIVDVAVKTAPAAFVKTFYSHITEKSANASMKNVYTFVIPKDTNKTEFAKFIKKEHKVNPIKIATINIPGEYRFVRGKKLFFRGYKKAMVYLKKGEKIVIS